jgi:hypothetical protein
VGHASEAGASKKEKALLLPLLFCGRSGQNRGARAKRARRRRGCPSLAGSLEEEWGCPSIVGSLEEEWGCPCIVGSLEEDWGCPCIVGSLEEEWGCPSIVGSLEEEWGCPSLVGSLEREGAAVAAALLRQKLNVSRAVGG